MFGGQRNRLLPKLAKRREQSGQADQNGTRSERGSGVRYRPEISHNNQHNSSSSSSLSISSKRDTASGNSNSRIMQHGSSTVSSVFQDSSPREDLKELNNAISRIEQIIRKPLQQYEESVKRNIQGEKEQIPSQKSKGNDEAERTKTNSISETGILVDNPGDNGDKESIEERDAIVDAKGTMSPTPEQRHAQFVTFSPSDEAELIELIRRVAELVVQGERRAATVDNMDAAAFHQPTRKEKASSNAAKPPSRRGLNLKRSSRNNSATSGENNGSTISSNDNHLKETTSEEELMAEAEIYKEKERQFHSALFDKFLERNVLSLLVNIATGTSFTSLANTNMSVPDDEKASISKLNDEKEPTADLSTKGAGRKVKKGLRATERQISFLPPLSVATQAVQSVAILLQNVSQATSLYLLLSNNRINDLIGLPMDLYSIAVETSTSSNVSKTQKYYGKNDHNKQIPPTTITTDSSAEMAELATHFVSFLKSLVMRINHETLQFFIRYVNNETMRRTSFSEGHVPLTNNEHESLNNNMIPDEIEFPLFARALDFCRTDQDSFVRLTAMNICLNTLRLGAVVVDRPRNFDFHNSDNEEKHGEPKKANSPLDEPSQQGIDFSYSMPRDSNRDSELQSSYLGTLSPKSPDASIEFVNLPVRERFAISHHICQPSRVQQLVGHIFSKLAEILASLEHRFDSLNDLIKEEVSLLEKEVPIDDTSSMSHDILDAAFEEIQSKRRKLSDSVGDIVADIQDELLMLDDIMKMDVAALNEQIIETMFSDLIYPCLLDPLLYQCASSMMQDSNKGQSVLEVGEIIESLSLRDQRHPFIISDDQSHPKSRGTSLESLAPSSSSSLSSTHNDEIDHKDSHGVIATKTSFFGLYILFHSMSNLRLKQLLLAALLHPFSPDTLSTECKQASTCSPPSSSVKERRKGNDERPSTPRNILTSGLARLLDENFETNEHIEQEDRKLHRKRNPYRQILLSCVSGPRSRNRDEVVLVLHHLAGMIVDVALSLTEHIPFSIISGSVVTKSDGTDTAASSGSREYLFEVIESLCFGIMTSSVCVNGIWRLDYSKATVNALLTLLQSDSITLDSSLIGDVINMLQTQKGRASSYIQQIPSFLDTATMEFLRLGDDGSNNYDFEAGLSARKGAKQMSDRSMPATRTSSFSMSDSQLQDLVMDRLVRDSLSGVGELSGFMFGISNKVGTDTLIKLSKSAVKERQMRQKEEGNEKRDQIGNHSLAIATCQQSTLASLISSACEANCCPASLQIRTKILGVTMDNAVSSLTAYFKFDALFGHLREIAERQREVGNEKSAPYQLYENLSNVGSATIVSKISNDLAEVLYDEQQQENNAPSATCVRNATNPIRPKPGAVVGLVGRVAFPCVCEVSKASEGLFTDQRACVVADGVKWQSLYLVFLARFMLLAEPVKEGSGGTGRIVTSCHLSCLSVVRDRTSVAKSASSARRLILKHESMAEEPPGVFSGRFGSSVMNENKRTFGAKHHSYSSSLCSETFLSSADGYIKLEESEKSSLMKVPVLTKSRMDLWFENESASEIAYETFRNKISKARAVRGNQVRSAFGTLSKGEE